MSRKQGVRLLMEAALDLPPGVLPPEGNGAGVSEKRRINARHNGALGGRPRNGETAQQAQARRFHMVDKEITPSPDGSNAVVVTYATHERA